MWSESHSVVSNSLQPHGLYSPWNSPGQNTGVGSLSLLQGIFPIQGSSPGLLHYRQFLYQLSHKGSPRILEWLVYPFSSRSSWPRSQNGVSCIAGGFFTSWAMREAYIYLYIYISQCYCLSSSHPLFPSPHSQVCSLCLHLYLAQCSVMTWRGGMGWWWEGGSWGRGYLPTYSRFLFCTAETNTTL